MIETAVFRIGMMRMIRHGDWLRSSARLAVERGRGGALTRLLQWKPAAKTIAWGCYAAGLSDCMMAVAERPS